MPHRERLLILSPLRAVPRTRDAVVVTRKFIAGMECFARHWGGPTAALLEPTPQATDNLDNVEVDTTRLGFELKIMGFDEPELEDEIRRSRIVAPFASYRQNHVGALCLRLGVPYVYFTEYSLRTRLQIVRCEAPNPIVRMRRYWWELHQERKNRDGIRAAAGVQCGGTPTYDAYRRINEDRLLYFGSRARMDMLPSEAELRRRTESMLSGRPLRLVYSGRLIKMKGVDHLPRLARELVGAGVPFELYVFGGGVLEDELVEEVRRSRLEGCVHVEGILDFESELVPFVKERADVFVCCHRQGDPSETYLETLQCGVPIIGYDNEAFLGVLEHAKVGWSVRMDQPAAMAERLGELHRNRSELAEAATRALRFGREHTFERTFRRRVDHLRAIAVRAEAAQRSV